VKLNIKEVIDSIDKAYTISLHKKNVSIQVASISAAALAALVETVSLLLSSIRDLSLDKEIQGLMLQDSFRILVYTNIPAYARVARNKITLSYQRSIR
jgi:hypothetical protein